MSSDSLFARLLAPIQLSSASRDFRFCRISRKYENLPQWLPLSRQAFMNIRLNCLEYCRGISNILICPLVVWISLSDFCSVFVLPLLYPTCMAKNQISKKKNRWHLIFSIRTGQSRTLCNHYKIKYKYSFGITISWQFYVSNVYVYMKVCNII